MAVVDDGVDHDHPFSTPRNAAQIAFHDAMRKLWEDHVTWTRLAIVTFAAGYGGFDATATRLLRNQVDIGNAVKPFYGDAAGAQLTALLHDHITIAVEILQAAETGTPTPSTTRTPAGTPTPTTSPTSSPPLTRSSGPMT